MVLCTCGILCARGHCEGPPQCPGALTGVSVTGGHGADGIGVCQVRKDSLKFVLPVCEESSCSHVPPLIA